jgi:hypothetical protein
MLTAAAQYGSAAIIDDTSAEPSMATPRSWS